MHRKSARYRIQKLKAEQEEILLSWIRAGRRLWNRLLAGYNVEHNYQIVDDFGDIQKIKSVSSIVDDFGNHYELLDGSYIRFVHRLTLLKQSHSWLSDIPIHTLQNICQTLADAIKQWRLKKRKCPKFKKIRSSGGSIYCTKALFKWKNNQISLGKKLPGTIKPNLHRPVEPLQKSASISVDPSGKWYISFVVEVADLPAMNVDRSKSVGIDLGIADYLICSDGTKVDNPKFYRRAQKQLKRAQQKLARKKYGSRNYEKQRIRVAVIHEQITRRRDGFLHQVAVDLLNKFDVICMENLNVAGMKQNHKLAKSISDASWGKFADILKWKALKQGKQVIQISRNFASSKTCSSCKTVYKELKLSEREWTCSSCGSHHDRDVNAANNIRTAGMAGIYACGDISSDLVEMPNETKSMNQEATCSLDKWQFT